jgi:hypothetical protein
VRRAPGRPFGMSGGGDLSAWISGLQEDEERRVGILEAYVGLGEQTPGPIEERISLATATSKVLVLDAPAAFV